MLVDVQDVGAGEAGGDGQVVPGVAGEPVDDLLGVGAGVAVAVAWWRGSSGRAGRGTRASRGRRRPGPGGGCHRSWRAPDRGRDAGVVGAAGGLGHQLGGQGGQDAGLVFGLGRQQAGGAVGLEVQDRPQGGRDVQGVQAQVVGFPAGREGGGQVAVAGAVDLLDPGAEPGQGFGAVGGREPPPRRGRVGLVAVGVVVGLGRPGRRGR